MTPFLAINSDYDAPSARMLVIVHSICAGQATIEYCGADVRYSPKWRRPFKVSESQITSIDRFGVRAELDVTNHQCPRVRCIKDEALPVTATYSDGKPRVWESSPRWFEVVSPKLVPIIQECMRNQP